MIQNTAKKIPAFFNKKQQFNTFFLKKSKREGGWVKREKYTPLQGLYLKINIFIVIFP